MVTSRTNILETIVGDEKKTENHGSMMRQLHHVAKQIHHCLDERDLMGTVPYYLFDCVSRVIVEYVEGSSVSLTLILRMLLS